MTGWISLHRSLLDHKLWKAEPFTKGQAWVDILLLTNHSDQIMTVKNGTMVEVKRGQCGYSELALGDRWKWSRGKVKRFLAVLSNQKMIHQKKVDNRTIIIVCNYDQFQTDSKQDSKRTVNGHLTGHQTDINNKETMKQCNNGNIEKPLSPTVPEPEKKKAPRKVFKPPAVEEVAAYCTEKGYGIDPEYFVDYHIARDWILSNGKKMKDWKATVRTWAKNNFSKGKFGNGRKPQQKTFDGNYHPPASAGKPNDLF